MEIVIIDIETTGFLNAGGKIVEIGAVKLDLDNGNRIPLLNYVCHEEGLTEDKLANSWIIKHSDLTVDQVKYSLSLLNILPKIQKIADTYPITAFNRVFDIGFLSNRGVKFENLYPCPMLELTPIMKLKHPMKYGNKWPNVEEAYKYFFPNSDYVEAHRALDDAMHEAEIVYKLYQLTNYSDGETNN